MDSKDLARQLIMDVITQHLVALGHLPGVHQVAIIVQTEFIPEQLLHQEFLCPDDTHRTAFLNAMSGITGKVLSDVQKAVEAGIMVDQPHDDSTKH